MAGTTRSQTAKDPKTRDPPKRAPLRAPARTRLSTIYDRSGTPANPIRSSVPSSVRTNPSPNLHSNAGLKRKDREFEHEVPGDTNIHVVVRCRGRNDREVKENSGVVVDTEGIKGTTVELSMGPNAMGNKAYNFDKVFSPAADQAIVFEEVVVPILNEMLAGYNCTIFAYGQTGTGKTYTMSGDMVDTLGLLSDAAGIIPRVLYALFKRLEETENSVKVSFIELYNEELRDLLSAEDNAKLKIYEDGAKKGHHGTMVQGMGESYIHSASDGIRLLQEGSHRRQVAATKCNDLSSRSHTVFTITAYIKRSTDKGEEFVSSGKLNLVDLAGSENIQRSGAENKRAAEAGLINKSLLTLGRVINALVDKSPHIPYRESKLTRLLQDSLGGRTKTCIIATISPSRSNLEETISTLDYAFRAKNIRNKPQINSTMSKKTLLREFTTEIEKLKSELIATRLRNGVYLSASSYEEMTVESESRRILTEEQRAKIESMEANLKNKVQELFTLTSNFNTLKRDNEVTQTTLDQTQDVLEKTEIVLQDTQQSLEEEAMLRKAHEATELELREIGTDLISQLERSAADADGLHSKLRRQSQLHHLNKDTWESSTTSMLDIAKVVGNRMTAFQSEHNSRLENLSFRVESYVTEELRTIEQGRSLIRDSDASLKTIEGDAQMRMASNRDEMNNILEEIKILRDDVQQKVGEGLNGLSSAAARISGEVIHELQQFQGEFHEMYQSLNEDFSSMFSSLVSHLQLQKEYVSDIRRQLQEANQRAVQASEEAASTLETILDEEKHNSERERAELMSQIQALLNSSADKQNSRLRKNINGVRTEMKRSQSALQQADISFDGEMDNWAAKEDKFMKKVLTSEGELKTKMADSMNVFSRRHASIEDTSSAVHTETVRIVDEQKADMQEQMRALDEFVTRARSENDEYYELNLQTVRDFASNIREAHDGNHDHLNQLHSGVEEFLSTIESDHQNMGDLVSNLTTDVLEPLSKLQSNIQDTQMVKYSPTGSTPEKVQYDCSVTLPQTESHDNLIRRLKGVKSPVKSPIKRAPVAPDPLTSPIGSRPSSPSKGLVYQDEDGLAQSPSKPSSTSSGLREIDINISRPPSSSLTSEGTLAAADEDVNSLCKDMQPPSKRRLSATLAAKANLTGESKMIAKRVRRNATTLGPGAVLEGRENLLPSALGSSVVAPVRRVRSGPQ
ncbi:Kinesin- motor protein [Emydomyces testavorans]|uniref:Kinesin- motor protein n=1 Tax=Emydomyces testavorans TaxID=2070801 RepID=A0AAF0DJV6_9EURO|nr:Kinesin- motor protein [Emydomyces testavorans]